MPFLQSFLNDMAGKYDHTAPAGHRPVHVLKAVRLDPSGGVEDADFAQMRIFGGDPAEIIPHRGDDARNLGFGQRGQGAGKVEPGAFGDAEPRTDGARQGAAHRRRPVERQNPEYAEEQGRTQGFDRMSKSEPTA